MKTKQSIFIMLLLVLFVISCSQKDERVSKPTILVYTSLYPIKYFTELIIPEAQIQTIIPHQVDPHNFEPSLKDIQNLFKADIIVYLGNTDVDRWIDKIRGELTQKGVKVVRLQDYIAFRKYSSINELDPHIWLDPISVIEVIRVIKDKAQEFYPEKKHIYEKNFNLYGERLKELDSLYKKTLSNCLLKDIVGSHEFLNYLSARYGFNFHFIVHEPEEEPSLKRIQKLKDLIKKNSIQYIICEPEGEKIAKILTEETGVRILKFNTFHQFSTLDYFQTMRDNLEVLKTALNCR